MVRIQDDNLTRSSVGTRDINRSSFFLLRTETYLVETNLKFGSLTAAC